MAVAIPASSSIKSGLEAEEGMKMKLQIPPHPGALEQ